MNRTSLTWILNLRLFFSESVVCLPSISRKNTYFIHFDEFSHLQSDDHLLQISLRSALKHNQAERSQDVDLLRQVRVLPTRSDGIRNKMLGISVKSSSSSHHLIIPSSLVPSSYHPKHVSKSSSHLALGLVDLEALQDAHGLGLEGEESGSPISQGYVVIGSPPMNISHGENGYL